MPFSKPKRRVSKVFLHCSASEHGDVEAIRRWHLERGWSDIGYHYVILKDGELEVGRPIEQTPAAQKGHNTGSIAICLIGLDKDLFTAPQRSTLLTLCNEIDAAYEHEVTFHGHCEVAAKACPVFDYRRWLDLDRNGKLFGGLALPDLEVLSRGEDVQTAQRYLNLWRSRENLPLVAEDGIFGQETGRAVRAFQKAHGLKDHGVVEVKTWSQLIPKG